MMDKIVIIIISQAFFFMSTFWTGQQGVEMSRREGLANDPESDPKPGPLAHGTVSQPTKPPAPRIIQTILFFSYTTKICNYPALKVNYVGLWTEWALQLCCPFTYLISPLIFTIFKSYWSDQSTYICFEP